MLKKFRIHNNTRLFKFIDVWKFLVAFLKWVKKYGSEEGGSKRTKVSETSYITSSDIHLGLDLNEEDVLEIEEVVCLMGRHKEKKRGSSSNTLRIGRGDAIENVASCFKIYNLNFEYRLNFKNDKSEEKKKAREEKQ